jgi:glutamyl/glutaminyl-tRNA synthetase
MAADETTAPASTRANPFVVADILAILRERGWLAPEVEPSAGQIAWCEHAAAILGPQAPDCCALEQLLSLVFHYDAQRVLDGTDAQMTLSRYGAREVIRHLARLVLADSGPVTPDRFQHVITRLKETLDIRGRELFYPLRLALAGRSGEGGLDRVILLLDEADAAKFTKPVKGVRARIVEFCTTLE